ncbi:MAG: enoyl-CoA hydratase/isomerase family protein [Candidatus Abyssobacteria bacterium SURF_17]|jgi:enoyl-CoA hydratase|uniref:Enoyl-CoA hydratase/isomerase family protein n=1 Tax=Candidatus Abyssobacteria bacterium SURF_17 TaxID=2093361 RepID=A0A419F4C8_9BACT|nr:MAG: enoyl-CoA hydratase/isomerase family protein [Candidatus Abyssubacteria bacterium SURF_17]
MGTGTVRTETFDEIAIVTLNKPPVNAIDLTLIHDAEKCLKSIEEDGKTLAVVITGSGKCFSAGLDLKTVPYYSQSEQRQMVEDLNRIVAWLYGFPLPIVTAINGHAIAGGFILAMSSDYRIGTSSSCKLGVTESRVGIPFPISTMEVMKGELAPAVSRRMILVGHTIGSEEALSQGVLDEIQTPDNVLPRAIAVAKDFASLPSEAYATIKRQLRAEALARMEDAMKTASDPLLRTWITDEGRVASAKHLASPD